MLENRKMNLLFKKQPKPPGFGKEEVNHERKKLWRKKP